MRRKQMDEVSTEVLYGTALLVTKWADDRARCEVYAINPARSMLCNDGVEHQVARVMVRTTQPGGPLTPMRTVVLPAGMMAGAKATGRLQDDFRALLADESAQFVLPDDDVAGALALLDLDIDDSALTGGPPNRDLALLSAVRRATKLACDEAWCYEKNEARHAATKAALSIESVATTTYRRLLTGGE